MSDWPGWRNVRIAALGEAPEAFKARLADWGGGGEAQWRARLRVPGAYNVVAELAGRTVGMARGEPAGETCGELRSGATTLRLAVLPDNAPAIALYRRNGFAPTGEPGDVVPGGWREVVMAKPLASPPLDDPTP